MALAFTAPRFVPIACELTEATLQGCRAGDPAALRVFVARYEHMVFAFLSRSVGHGPHVEDMAQEVFLRACRALAHFDASGQARLSTWILTIARRLVVDARRKRLLPFADVDADVVAAGDTPETERRRHEIASAIERAAVELSDDQRDIFLLAEFHGLDTKELATVLGISEATAKTRLFRARERLRALLRDVWEDQ